jgi:hypothetical protein
MNRKILVMAIGISFLLALPALVIRPTNATEVPTTGLDAAYWKGSYFGITSLPTWPGCPASALPGPPAGTPSGTPPTATETDPKINFGSTTGFYWDESYAIGTNPSSDIAGPPGNPGGFAVTDGGYGVALSSWGDPNLYSDYPTSTYFVDTGFSVEWTGYIYLNTGTTYLFQLQSDDGSWLYINTTPGSSTISSANIVINNGAEQPPTTATSGDVSVASTGYYPIEVDYFETCDTQSGIDLSWATVIPSAAPSFSIIPTTAFLPAQIGSNAPTTPTGVPQFSLALPVVAALGFVALALVRKRTFSRTDATA